MRAQITNRDYEQLSAYIDGQLAPRERERLEARLSAQPELQTALEDLNRTRTLLRQAPRRHAPRNFTLTPAVAEQVRPRRRKGSAWNLFPALSFASALATLALVATFVLQMLPGTAQTANTAFQKAAPSGASNSAPSVQATTLVSGAPAAKQAAPESAPAAAQPAATPATGAMAIAPQAADQAAGAAASEQSAPPVVAWNGASPYNNNAAGAYGMGGGGGGGMGGGGGGGPLAGGLLGPPEPPAMVYGKESGQPLIYGAQSGAGTPMGSLTLPPESVNSLDSSARSAAAPAQPNPAISGSGPILGVAPQGQGGQIVEQRALLGQPESVAAASPASPQPATGAQPALGAAEPTAAAAQPEVANPPGAPALPANLPLFQGLLAAVAVITGVAAFILWRRRA